MKQGRSGCAPTAGSAGWNPGEPPRDGKTRVIIGRVTWRDEGGGGSYPVLTEARFETHKGRAGWLGPDGLSITSDLTDTLHIDWWIDLPNTDNTAANKAEAARLRDLDRQAWKLENCDPDIMTTPKTPLTISSKYFEENRTQTRSTNPATLKRLIQELRCGDGDEIQITDADGNTWDLIDLGQGLELRPRH